MRKAVRDERLEAIEDFFGINRFDFAFLDPARSIEPDHWQYVDLEHQGLNADEIDLELARKRQAPLFINPQMPLEHGQPGGPGSDWAIIHDRSVENIRRAFDRPDRTITEAAKRMVRGFDFAKGRGRGFGMSQQALSKLIKTPEKMHGGQAGTLASYLGCTLDYMRGLVDDRGQFYGSASTKLIATVYESLSPSGRAIATEMLKSIACRDAVIDRFIEATSRAKHRGDEDSDGTAGGI